MNNYSDVSFWFDSLDKNIQARPSLTDDIDVDVAIIGAGFTGLWTAYYLKQQKPDLSIAIIESEIAGFGASGRNGGWLKGSIEGESQMYAGLSLEQRQQVIQQVTGIVEEVKTVTQRENIDCDLHHGGVVYSAARYQEQLKRVDDSLSYFHGLGYTDDDYHRLTAAETKQYVNVRGCLGGIFIKHVATINPAKLARGLSDTVEALGVTIYENTKAHSFNDRVVVTDNGQIKANIIVPAVEGYWSGINSDLKNHTIPIISNLVATAPLTEEQWQEIGFDKRPAFRDSRRLHSYAHRSADDRLIFGARGSYLFNSKIRQQHTLSPDEYAFHIKFMLDFFPSLEGVEITHNWSGTLGMSRRYSPHVIFDPKSGLALAGGYSGAGVGASNLLARTTADLILEKNSELTTMPWVFNQSPNSVLKRWEPEPFRWLGYKTIRSVFSWEENVDNNPDSPLWKKKTAHTAAKILAPLLGY